MHNLASVGDGGWEGRGSQQRTEPRGNRNPERLAQGHGTVEVELGWDLALGFPVWGSALGLSRTSRVMF